MRFALPALALLVLTWMFPTGSLTAQDAQPEAPGLKDPGTLQSLVVDTGRVADGVLVISGRDAGQQLLITGVFDSGQVRDLTRKVSYEVLPEGIIQVDETGYITTQTEGEATVHVRMENGPDTTV